MKRLIKGFQQFVNEGHGQHSDLSGQSVSFQNFAFLSDEQLQNLDLSGQDQDDAFDEVAIAMVDPLLQKLGLNLSPDGQSSDGMTYYDLEYYDITVDLENGTYTLHGVYEADAASYSLNIVKPIKVNAQLPITLPIPKVVSDIISTGYERVDGPSEEDRTEYRQLAKDWAETSRQHPRDAHSKFGDEKMNRFNDLGRTIHNPRNRR